MRVAQLTAIRRMATVLAVLLMFVAVPASASAQDPPPPPPECDIDGNPFGCAPTNMKTPLVFQATAANAYAPTTICTVTMDGATPPAPAGRLPGYAQYRTGVGCDRGLNIIELDTWLTDGVGNRVSTGSQVRCYGKGACYSGVSQGDKDTLDAGEYFHKARVRLVLDEPDAPDPWTTVPPGESEPNGNLKPSCSAGGFEVICIYSQSVTVKAFRNALVEEVCENPVTISVCYLNPPYTASGARTGEESLKP